MEELEALQAEVGELRIALARAGGPLAGLVGKSPAMQEIFADLLDAADDDPPILIAGETGAGKKAAALALHRLSRRRFLPFARYGEPGQSDAGELRPGTLLLESIHLVPIETQRQALGFSEETGIRLVATSVREPEAAAREGKLLPELLSQARPIALPPLRHRKEDIPMLAAFFLREIERGENNGVEAIDPKALEAMNAHEWPGNVRELKTVMRRAHALTAGASIGLTAIQSVLGGSSARPEGAGETPADQEIVPVRVGDSMADVERRVLQRTLEFAKGNKRKAAEMLELSLKTIYNKVKEYGLERQFNRRFRKDPRSESPLRSGNR
jgi:DNA-binding NtrC family response regulator